MTTIVYRDGILAADSRACNDDWIQPTNDRKLYRLRDGRAAATAGSAAAATALLRWIESDRSTPQPTGRATVVVVDTRNRVEVFEDGASYYEGPMPFGAWGSGMPVALGALHAGVDAVKAVKIAALVDPSTDDLVCFIRPVTSEFMESHRYRGDVEDGVYVPSSSPQSGMLSERPDRSHQTPLDTLGR